MAEEKEVIIVLTLPESELELIVREIHRCRNFLFEAMPHTGLLAYFVGLHLLDRQEREDLFKEVPNATS